MPNRSTRPAELARVGYALSGLRAVLGFAAILFPRPLRVVLGIPRQHDNASARMIGRLFGVREVLIAAATFTVLRRRPRRSVYGWNALVDGGDAVLLGLTLLGRRGIPRAALNCLAVAVPLCATWLWLRGQTD
jgi:hypothetical protein